ncbi:MAG: peptidylprolyl isomerase [Puniceicoccaceae bacterium]
MNKVALSLILILAGILPLQGDILVNTRLSPEASVTKSQALELDLRDFFQVYPEPGPVATFNFRMPVQAGPRQLSLNDGGQTYQIMTYELESGGTYDNFYDVRATDFKWESHSLQWQLLADVAPVTVANFMTYADSGAYTNTVIHRSEIDVLQGGGWVHDWDGSFPLGWIETNPPIPLERTLANPAGSLAMARRAEENSATSQFYINVADNSSGFGDNYAVFGQLLSPANALPVLEDMSNVTVWNYGGAFSALPIYAGYLEDVDSWMHFDSIVVSEGNPDGVNYSWEWMDTDGDDILTDAELNNRSVFSISLENGILKIDRNDSGDGRIRITGSAIGQSKSIEVYLLGMNPDALFTFPESSIHRGGFISNDWYGWIAAEDYPYIQHLNHGYQYVWFYYGDDPSQDAWYFYDFTMESWLYTRPSFYPYLFAYGRDAWLWYVIDTGNGVSEKRWFYDFKLGDWIQE